MAAADLSAKVVSSCALASSISGDFAADYSVFDPADRWSASELAFFADAGNQMTCPMRIPTDRVGW
jgi:hypothetical protein